MPFWNITKPTAGTGVSKANIGDKLIDNDNYLYALRYISKFVLLNGATPLTTGDKAYWRVPAILDGGVLHSVAAHCKDASSSGAVEIAVKIGPQSLLTTNITLDQAEVDTLTAAAAAVIDTAHDDLAEGDYIEFSVVSAGTGVTWCGIEFVMEPA